VDGARLELVVNGTAAGLDLVKEGGGKNATLLDLQICILLFFRSAGKLDQMTHILQRVFIKPLFVCHWVTIISSLRMSLGQ
jgi:hypothetical protein